MIIIIGLNNYEAHGMTTYKLYLEHLVLHDPYSNSRRLLFLQFSSYWCIPEDHTHFQAYLLVLKARGRILLAFEAIMRHYKLTPYSPSLPFFCMRLPTIVESSSAIRVNKLWFVAAWYGAQGAVLLLSSCRTSSRSWPACQRRRS